MIGDIIGAITSILVLAIPFVMKIIITKQECKLTSKIEALEDKIDKINKQNLESQINLDFTVQLLNIKNYYLKSIEDEKLHVAAAEKASKFVDTVSGIINRYKIDINNLSHIKQELCVAFGYGRNRMIEYIGSEKANHIFKMMYSKRKAFFNNIEDILTESPNHYKERFVTLCICYLKSFLKDIKSM